MVWVGQRFGKHSSRRQELSSISVSTSCGALRLECLCTEWRDEDPNARAAEMYSTRRLGVEPRLYDPAGT